MGIWEQMAKLTTEYWLHVKEKSTKVLIGTYNYTVQLWVTGGNKYNVLSITLPSLLLLAENHSLFLFNHLHLENSKEHGNFAQLGNFSAQVYKTIVPAISHCVFPLNCFAFFHSKHYFSLLSHKGSPPLCI